MRISVAVLDSGSSGIAALGPMVLRAIDSEPSLQDVCLVEVSTASDVLRVLKQSKANVLLLPAPAEFEDGRSGIEVALEVSHEASVQVVLCGVTERDLVRVNANEGIILLPRTFDDANLASALCSARMRVARWSEQPFLVRTRSRDSVIMPRTVSFVESDRRRVSIHTGNEVVVAYAKLSEVLRMLPSRFVQCHKSFVVNMGFIKDLGREGVRLTTGELIPVSQNRRKYTREMFCSYVGKSI